MVCRKNGSGNDRYSCIVNKSKTIKQGVTWQAFESIYYFSLNFVLIVIVARFIDAEVYGTYTTLFVVVVFLSEFTDFGFKDIIIREQYSEPKTYVVYILLLFSASIFLLLYELTVTLFWDRYQFASCSVLYAQTFGILIVLLAINNFLTNVYRKELWFKKVAIVRAVSYTITFVVTIGLTAFYKDKWGLLIGLVVGEISRLLIFRLSLNWKKGIVSFERPKQYLREFRNSVGLYLSHLLGYTSRNIDYLLIAALLGAEDVGIYALAYKIMSAPVKLIGGVINKIMFPIYGKEKDPTTIAEMFCFSIRTISFYSSIAFFVLASISQNLINVLFTSEWVGAGSVLSIMSLAGIFLIIHNATEPLLKVTVRQKILVYRQLFYLFVIVSCITAGAMVGLIWACVGFLVALFLSFAISVKISFDSIGIDFKPTSIRMIVHLILGLMFYFVNNGILFLLSEYPESLVVLLTLLIDMMIFIVTLKIYKNWGDKGNRPIFIPKIL